MIDRLPTETDPVLVSVAGRELRGVVDEVRWHPRYNAPPHETTQVAVDVDGTTFVTSPDQLTPLS